MEGLPIFGRGQAGLFADCKLTVEPRGKSAEDFLRLALRDDGARDVEIVILR